MGFKAAVVFLFFFISNVGARVSYSTLFKSNIKDQKLIFSGSKYLVGSIEIEITISKKKGKIYRIKCDEKAYIMGIKVQRTLIDTTVSIDDFKPVKTIYREYRKSKSRFEYYFRDHMRYIRITGFMGNAWISPSGKFILPGDFIPSDHEVKESTHYFKPSGTLIFDPGLLLASLAHYDRNKIKSLKNTELIFTSMERFIPFKVIVVKEDSDKRYIELKYRSKDANKMDLRFDSIVIDKRKKVITKIIGSEKHVGNVSIKLRN